MEDCLLYYPPRLLTTIIKEKIPICQPLFVAFYKSFRHLCIKFSFVPFCLTRSSGLADRICPPYGSIQHLINFRNPFFCRGFRSNRIVTNTKRWTPSQASTFFMVKLVVEQVTNPTYKSSFFKPSYSAAQGGVQQSGLGAGPPR